MCKKSRMEYVRDFLALYLCHQNSKEQIKKKGPIYERHETNVDLYRKKTCFDVS